jgi:TnpA family transposase
MIKYATAIRTRTASTEAILQRFTRNASHPMYTAMLEVGRAEGDLHSRYLRLPELQREIKRPERRRVLERRQRRARLRQARRHPTNRRDEQELFVLCLRILQAALVHVNTLMLQGILEEPAWADILTPADRRGLTPLFWMHVPPYGEVNLDMTSRLDLGPAVAFTADGLAQTG